MMKKNRRIQLVKLMLLGFLWVSSVSLAKADTITTLLIQIRNATQATADYVNSILSDLQSTGKQVLEALTAPTPEITDVTKANTQIGSSISKNKADYEQPLTLIAIRNILTNTVDRLNSSTQAELLTLPGPDFPKYESYTVAPNLTVNMPVSPNEKPSPFDLGTLIGKVAFSDGSTQGEDCQSSPKDAKAGRPLCQSYAAQGFIGYVSGLVNPPVVPAFRDLKKRGVTQDATETFRNTAKVQSYLAELRAYTAAQSVGLNNFYNLYAERIIQPGLGKTLNVHKYSTVDANGKITPGEVIPDVSPLQAEEYLAKRRVYDPAWYKDMESATSPLTLARETLYILAEIRLEMFKARMENERLLAAISALQLQGLKTQKTLLDQQANGIDLPKSPASTPPPPPQTGAAGG